ncbi:MAG: histidine kinase, partial [Hormoscilla sp.]
LAIALRTAPEHEPTGIVLVADYSGRHWGEQYLDAFGVLVRQLAWSRRTLTLTSQFQSRREELELINWYKQRRTEEIYRSCGGEVKKLHNLGLPKNALTLTRYQQGLRQLTNTIGSLTSMLKYEQWQLQYNSTKIPLVSLLKRALERVERLIKQRQLWSQVHGDTGLSIVGDIVKVELVLYELLVIACQRSNPRGRIDIWSAFGEGASEQSQGGNSQSSINNSRLLQLSISYSGVLDPRLISELQTSRLDLLAFSTLDRPPGLNLIICQSLMRRMGGDFHLYQLEDGRFLSRLLLPIAHG